MVLAASLEQQWYVCDDDVMSPVAAQKVGSHRCHCGMDDRLQPLECLTIVKHRMAKRGTIDSPNASASRKRRLDREKQCAAGPLEPVNRGVCIEHRNAGSAKHRRDGRLAHADRSGETEQDHAVSSARNSASRSRGGSAP
jgi:hypothetical protein